MSLWPSLSLCRLLGPPLLKIYFDASRNPLKNTCLLSYAVFSLKVTCTCSLLHRDPRTSRNVHKNKIIGVFYKESRINWLLAFHMPGNAPTRPSIIHWRAIYWASWMHWRRRILESKETIVHCCLICLCLSLHPFIPLEHTLLLFPIFPLLCNISIEMED